jgi:hypothetical protein
MPVAKPMKMPMQAPVPAPQAAPPVPQEEKAPDKGSFPIGIIAAIQSIYMIEQQKQERLQGNLADGMGLKSGWGGQN